MEFFSVERLTVFINEILWKIWTPNFLDRFEMFLKIGQFKCILVSKMSAFKSALSSLFRWSKLLRFEMNC